MSKKENELFELKETCNFLDVFKNCSEASDSLSSGKYPDAQIGHIRAYWNEDGWQGSYFPCRSQLWTKAFHQESQDIYRCLVTQLEDLECLRKFCVEHPASSVSEYEYDFFMNGHVADYWIRFITRENDYNLYLKGFAKMIKYIEIKKSNEERRKDAILPFPSPENVNAVSGMAF